MDDSEHSKTQAKKVAAYELKDLPEDRAVYVKEGTLFFKTSKEKALQHLAEELNTSTQKPQH